MSEDVDKYLNEAPSGGGNYLKVGTAKAGDKVKIEGVSIEPFKDDKGKELSKSLVVTGVFGPAGKLGGEEVKVRLSKGNADSVKQVLGPKSAEWIGHFLYCTGEKTYNIRGKGEVKGLGWTGLP